MVCSTRALTFKNDEKQIPRWAFALSLPTGNEGRNSVAEAVFPEGITRFAISRWRFYPKKAWKYLLYLKPLVIFAKPEGRNPWVKNAFLALSHVTKSPNFSRGMRTMQRSFCLYTPRTAHAVPHKVYTTAWGICFSVHFYDGVWRCQ